MAERRKYGGAGASPETKEAIGLFAAQLKRVGVSFSASAELLQNTPYSPSKSTLAAHAAARRRGEEPLSKKKKSGKELKVPVELQHVLAGWVFLQTTAVELSDVTTACNDLFGITISNSTSSRLMKKLGLSLQLASTRPTTRKRTAQSTSST